MKTKLYKAITTFLGADAPSAVYFDSRKKAEAYLDDQDNGEVKGVVLESDESLNYSDGCTYNDLTWGFEISAEEIPEKYWWAVDECKTDVWTVKFDTREEALQHMKNDWNLLSRKDKTRRQGFYIGYAEAEAEDENTPNWDTMEDIVNIEEVES